MKLRLQGNALRLRLTQPDVRRFCATGRVAETTHFGPDRQMTYAVEASEDVAGLRASFDGTEVTVQVPRAWAAAWAESERVGFEEEQPLPGGGVLTLLVEKDFQCLHRDAEAGDANTFPHPQAPES